MPNAWVCIHSESVTNLHTSQVFLFHLLQFVVVLNNLYDLRLLLILCSPLEPLRQLLFPLPLLCDDCLPDLCLVNLNSLPHLSVRHPVLHVVLTPVLHHLTTHLRFWRFPESSRFWYPPGCLCCGYVFPSIPPPFCLCCGCDIVWGGFGVYRCDITGVYDITGG